MSSLKEFELAPDPGNKKLTRRVKGTDHEMKAVTTSVTVERPLTLFLNSQEIVTMMTISDYPEYLAVGYLVNQNMLLPHDVVVGIDYDDDGKADCYSILSNTLVAEGYMNDFTDQFLLNQWVKLGGVDLFTDKT